MINLNKKSLCSLALIAVLVLSLFPSFASARKRTFKISKEKSPSLRP